ncbi:MAG TPA: universal stress protein [Candidatus Limnocylindrales bacterium]|nr:universal stress protein [Candidatus Limnocylindrales bacterium]
MDLPDPADPQPGTVPQLRRVLLATDLSPTSTLATDWAFELARRNDAALLVVSVIDTRDLVIPGGGYVARVDQVRERRESVAQRLVTRGRAAGVPVTFLVWTGDPGESIVEAAVAEAVDVVLVGAHNRGTIGRLLMGSVSDYVARHAPCPVLIVREPPKTSREVAGAA